MSLLRTPAVQTFRLLLSFSGVPRKAQLCLAGVDKGSTGSQSRGIPAAISASSVHFALRVIVCEDIVALIGESGAGKRGPGPNSI